MNAAMAFWVFLGSGLGGLARWLLAELLNERFRVGLGMFPIGTLVVNVLGSLLIGLALPWARESQILFFALMIGFCGGFTTFSSFSLDTLALLGKGDWALALLDIVLSVLICVGACALGVWIGRSVHG